MARTKRTDSFDDPWATPPLPTQDDVSTHQRGPTDPEAEALFRQKVGATVKDVLSTFAPLLFAEGSSGRHPGTEQLLQALDESEPTSFLDDTISGAEGQAAKAGLPDFLIKPLLAGLLFTAGKRGKAGKESMAAMEAILKGSTSKAARKAVRKAAAQQAKKQAQDTARRAIAQQGKEQAAQSGSALWRLAKRHPALVGTAGTVGVGLGAGPLTSRFVNSGRQMKAAWESVKTGEPVLTPEERKAEEREEKLWKQETQHERDLLALKREQIAANRADEARLRQTQLLDLLLRERTDRRRLNLEAAMKMQEQLHNIQSAELRHWYSYLED